MTNDKAQPCLKRIDADCFRAHPAWAKQAFAYRLVHLLTPKALTKRLPKGLRTALLAPGVEIPPGVDVPGGIVVAPGAQIPAGWQPADPVPPGITIPSGTVFPPGWTPGDPIPDGVTLEPGATFPPGWTPGDPLPPGAIETPLAPPGVAVTGAVPPAHTAPFTPGPTHAPAPSPPAAITVSVIADTSDGYVNMWDVGWDTVHDAEEGNGHHYSKTWTDEAMLAANYAPDFYIARSFLAFNLSEIPAGKTIQEASLLIAGASQATSNVTLQQGDQHDVLERPDYDAYFDPLFGLAQWQVTTDPPNDSNVFILNQAGLDYLTTVLGLWAKFCLREYEHDYLDVQPPAAETFFNGMYYANTTDPDYKPTLTITYK